MSVIVNKFQNKLVYNLLTNKGVSIKIINNKLVVLNNPSNINILDLLNKNGLTYKIRKF